MCWVDSVLLPRDRGLTAAVWQRTVEDTVWSTTRSLLRSLKRSRKACSSCWVWADSTSLVRPSLLPPPPATPPSTLPLLQLSLSGWLAWGRGRGGGGGGGGSVMLVGSSKLLAGGVGVVSRGVCAVEGAAGVGVVGASSMTMSVRREEEEKRKRRRGVMI